LNPPVISSHDATGVPGSLVGSKRGLTKMTVTSREDLVRHHIGGVFRVVPELSGSCVRV
jgi:hypothetical protein